MWGVKGAQPTVQARGGCSTGGGISVVYREAMLTALTGH